MTSPTQLQPVRPAQPDSETVLIRGSRLSYRQAGRNGAGAGAVVFLHGLGGGSATWRRQYESLAATRRVVGWDMPGYGGSDPLPGAPQAQDYADILCAFLGALDLSRVHLVGQSVAALIAAAFARKSPGRLRSVVFAHPLMGFGGLPARERTAAAEQRIRPFESLGADGFAKSRGPRLLAPGADGALIDEVVSTMALVPLDGYRQAVMMMKQADLLATACGIDVPSLVVAGSDDPLAPPETCRGLAAALPGSSTALIDRAGHYAALERPEPFNRTLQDFFEAVDAGNGRFRFC